MRIGIVINPISGRSGSHAGEAARRRAVAESSAAAAGVEATVVMTERRGHARDLARTFVEAGCATVVAMGGDGTVNEVAQALVGTGTAIGIVPAGSGDGLARGLGLSREPELAMRLALSSDVTPIDVGYLGERLFLNVAGIGFDASVAQLFATRSTRGGLGYVTSCLRLVWTYAASEYDVRWQAGTGQESRRGRKFLLGFANAPTYGNGAILALDANPTDGLLDLVLVEAGGPLRQIWRARRFFWRHRHRADGFERARTSRATVRGSTIVGHVDGEPFETSGIVEIRVRPKALLLRARLTC